MVAATAAFRADAPETCSMIMTNGVIVIKPGSKVPRVSCVSPPDVVRMKSGRCLVGGDTQSGAAGWVEEGHEDAFQKDRINEMILKKT